MNFSDIDLPSDKKIGYFFSIIFVVLSIYFYYKNLIILSFCFFLIGLFLIILSIFKPIFIRPLNISWMFLGFLLGKIISPIVLGLLYFLVFTPVSLIQSIFGRDELHLKNNNLLSSWKYRNPIGPSEKSFKQQF